MLLAMENASNSIDLEQFKFIGDSVGRRFAEVLKRKAVAGVKVRLIVDYAGSFSFINSSLASELIKAGVELKYFNPIRPWRLHLYASWFRRDHRKILIIDSKIFFTGGVGIEATMVAWRDTVVRLEGAILGEANYIFNRMWQIVSEGGFKRFRLDRFAESPMRFLTNSPHFRQRYLYRRMRRGIAKARKYIYLTTPYFIPNSRFLFSLIKAARRGVDVRIITPEHSDHSFVDMARNSYYTLAIRSGVKIYHYKETVLHAKTIVIDDNWGSIGSANLDNLSFVFNYEANVVSTDEFFVANLKDHFINDLLGSVELKAGEWYQRPFIDKAYELITWPFHGLL